MAKLKGPNLYKSERRPDGQHSLVLGTHRGQRESHTHRSQFQDLTYNLNGFNNITSMKTVAKSLTYFIYIYMYVCTYLKEDVSHNHRFLKFRGSNLGLYMYISQ